MMRSGEGQLVETYLDGGGLIACPPELIPTPGQYLLAQNGASDSPLAVPVFFSASAPHGFRSAPPLPASWTPGIRLFLRGPLGHSFHLPLDCRRVVLVAFDDSPARLRGLIPLALKQGAAITLVSDDLPEEFPEEVEIQPMKSLIEIVQWADYVAVDSARESLLELRNILNMAGPGRGPERSAAIAQIEVLVRTSMPCGAMAECGVCAVTVKNGWLMVCKDGPVFDYSEIK